MAGTGRRSPRSGESTKFPSLARVRLPFGPLAFGEALEERGFECRCRLVSTMRAMRRRSQRLFDRTAGIIKRVSDYPDLTGISQESVGFAVTAIGTDSRHLCSPRPKLERVLSQDRCQAALEAEQRRGEMRSYEPRSPGAGPHQSIGMKSP